LGHTFCAFVRLMDNIGQSPPEFVRYTCLPRDMAQQRRLVESAHVDCPFDDVLAGAEGEFAVRRAGDWHAPDIESRREPAIDLHFSDTCGMALFKRGEIHVGEPHGALDLPRLGTRQEH
jgi:hypothetical protein